MTRIVLAGNDLSDSCHACQHTGSKVRSSFLPQQRLLLQHRIFLINPSFFSAFLPEFPNLCCILNSSWLLTDIRPFPQTHGPSQEKPGNFRCEISRTDLFLLQTKRQHFGFLTLLEFFSINLGIQCETKDEETVDLQSKARTLICLLSCSARVKSNAFLKGTFQVSSVGSTPHVLMSGVKKSVFDLAQMCKNSILSPLKAEETIHSPSFL